MITLEDFFVLRGEYTRAPRVVLPFHRRIFRALEMVLTGTLPDGKKNLKILIPPRHTKTLSVVDFISFSYGLFPDSQYLYTSYSATMSEAKTKEIRDTITSEYFKELFLPPSLTRSLSDFVENVFGGAIYGVGFGGTITGFGAGRKRKEFGGAIIIDDPIKPQDALSETIRERTNNWYTNTLKSRKNHDETPIILIMQRVHKNDLAGYIDENESEDWHTLEIPAYNEATGKALWEETISAKSLLKLKERDPFTFYSQYQQKPIVSGGQVIKTEWFKYYTDVNPNEVIRVFICADTAQKVKEHNDFSVFTCWAQTANGIYLTDGIKGKWDAVDLENVAIAFWNKNREHFGRSCSLMYVEDKSSGTGLIQTLQRKTSIPIVGVPRVIDKLTRLLDVLGYIQAGKVFLPIDKSYGFNPMLLSECESFRRDMAHDHDDIIDTMIDALNLSFTGNSVLDAL